MSLCKGPVVVGGYMACLEKSHETCVAGGGSEKLTAVRLQEGLITYSHTGPCKDSGFHLE